MKIEGEYDEKQNGSPKPPETGITNVGCSVQMSSLLHTVLKNVLKKRKLSELKA